jgi:hypothetical protein
VASRPARPVTAGPVKTGKFNSAIRQGLAETDLWLLRCNVLRAMRHRGTVVAAAMPEENSEQECGCMKERLDVCLNI